MSRFVPVDRDSAYLLPPSVQECLPEGHLARYVVDVVEVLDLAALERQYAGRGSDAHHPGTLLGLLIYGDATGVHASRAIERASYDSVAFRFVAGNTHPDHDTIATLRRRFGPEIKALFVQVLLIARTNGLLKLGNAALDATRVKANASQHRALSHGHALKWQEPLYEPAQAQFEAMQAERERRQNAGRRPPGPPLAPPSAEVDPQAQVKLSDADSRIMKVSGQGFEQGYNAQLAVDLESRLIVAPGLTQELNDKQPLIALGRERHHLDITACRLRRAQER